MTKRSELTVQNVKSLGSERLASLLLSAAKDDPSLMRMLRVAVDVGAAALGRVVKVLSRR